MSGTAVLLCSRVRQDAAAEPGASVPAAAIVDDLCEHPREAGEAVCATGATRVVLGLCTRRPSAELVAALRRAGTDAFGIEAVMLSGRAPEEAARLVAAARAKLEALPRGERGRSALNGNAISRRSLLSVGGAVTQVRVAALDEAACVGTSRCGLCTDACPTGAIARTQPVPSVDPGACTACGRCVPGCPHGALRLTGAAPAQLEAQLDELVPGMDGIVFACERADAAAPPGWALVELPTLALLTLGWVLQVRARGAEVALAPCSDPTCCTGAEAVVELAEQVGRLATTPLSASPGRLRLGEPLATAEAVRRLLPRGAPGPIEAEASPLGVLALDADRCTLCGACAAACPTDALRLDEGDRRTELRLDGGACVACGRCVAACPEHVLAVRRGLDVVRLAEGAVELVRARRETCAACGADLPPAQMRRRLRELLPDLAAAPVGLCARCAARSARGSEPVRAG